jgi:diguanylate cyclase (GGDEF)-like protein
LPAQLIADWLDLKPTPVAPLLGSLFNGLRDVCNYLAMPFIVSLGRSLPDTAKVQSLLPGVIEWIYPMTMVFLFQVERAMYGSITAIGNSWQTASFNAWMRRTKEKNLLDEVSLHQATTEVSARAMLRPVIQDLTDEVETLRSKVNRDSLTRLYNRGVFDARLASTVERAKLLPLWVGLMMIDIDHFKQINDSHGHATGDHVLVAVAKVIQEEAERAGLAAFRYGGEEFAVIVDQGSAESAEQLAETIRRKIKAIKLYHAPKVTLSASLGLFMFKLPNSRHWVPTPDMVIESADKLLYESKANGRDRLTFFRLK